MSQNGRTSTEERSFEEHLEALEHLVEELEAGELCLDDMLERYEQGMALIATCQDRLDHAELRITEIAAGSSPTDDA